MPSAELCALWPDTLNLLDVSHIGQLKVSWVDGMLNNLQVDMSPPQRYVHHRVAVLRSIQHYQRRILLPSASTRETLDTRPLLLLKYNLASSRWLSNKMNKARVTVACSPVRVDPILIRAGIHVCGRTRSGSATTWSEYRSTDIKLFREVLSTYTKHLASLGFTYYI